MYAVHRFVIAATQPGLFIYVSHVFLYGIYVSLPRQQKGQWDLREKCPAFLICDQKLNTDQLKQCNFLNCFFP